MYKHGKYCPILVAGGNMNLSGVCMGKNCAWFLPFANDCTFPLVAGILADSTICQNIFGQGTNNDNSKDKNEENA